jgi:deoxyribodipyrimidine photo-lyase
LETAIVVFTRDLRLHDNPALHRACARARQVMPLFVCDPAIKAPPNRARFLAESLTDLSRQLRERGAGLVIRTGDPAAEVIALATQTAARAVYLAGDVSRYAARDGRRLERECARHRLDVTVTPGLTVVPPGELRPAGGGHYRVFTAYWRAWHAAGWRRPCPVPDVITMPAVRNKGRIPPAGQGTSPALAKGGETEGRRRLAAFRQHHLAGYPATTTICPATRRRGSAPTCGSAASRRWRRRPARRTGRPEMSRARSSAASWPGATSSAR